MQKHTLYIVPGWLHTSDEWRAAPAQLEGWDVRLIDLPGFGKIPLPSKDWGVPEYSKFVRHKIKDIGYTTSEKTVFLGHSFGGRVLAHMLGSMEAEASEISRENSLAKPDLLILYAAPCLYRPKTSVYLRNKLARMAKKTGLTRIIPKGVSAKLVPSDTQEADALGMREVFRRSIPYSQEEALAHIQVPTHLIWGQKDDHVLLPIAEEIQKIIPHAQLTVLPHEGHNIHLDNPALFFGTLRKILAGI